MWPAIHVSAPTRRALKQAAAWGIAWLLLVSVGCQKPGQSSSANSAGQPPVEHADPHGEAHPHDHGHDHEHDEPALEISPEARISLGIETLIVKRGSFQRALTLPAMIVDRPGRTHREVGTHFAGIITHIHAQEGEALAPGEDLAHLHLVHEELVQSQSDLLKTVEELAVVKSEIQRLQAVSVDGVIAGRTFLERQYELQKLEALLSAQRQALTLHGLTKAQVEEIIQKRELLHGMDIVVSVDEEHPSDTPFWQVEKLKVHTGEHTAAGQSICTLADYSQLDLEGIAFETDLPALVKAVAADAEVTAVLEHPGGGAELVNGLKIRYIANEVDPASRSIKFIVRLPNEIVRDVQIEGRRYVSWRFRPGQRLQVRVPVEAWQERIVLPASAVVQDQLESYVFVEDEANHFHRHGIAVEYRDPQWVVVAAADNGEPHVGDRVVTRGAEQLQLAWKQRSGGETVDAHGHHHH